MAETTAPSAVFEGVTLDGSVNVPDEGILQNVRFAIRQQHPQLWPQQPCLDRVCLVGGGGSLAKTEKELVRLVHEGAKLVTVNGAYHWCIERNLRPTAQIVVDARQSNARFLEPEVPQCRYYLASQCHPDAWAAVAGRPWVGIFHCAAPDNDVVKPILDDYYQGNWVGSAGGSTVILRAVGLLRSLGYLRFDLFGVDSCWMGESSHAYAQPENDADGRIRCRVSPKDRPELAREFWVAPWHLAQAEDFIKFIRHQGDSVLLNIHGDGLLAFLLASSGDIETLD